ncbi:hypothetical protein [Aliidiomarina sp.]|uniref:hypothetical protein n=1 Tax=Aliidiomarina sp. TaxID=1872439 RepID=UPI003A4D4E1E
MKSIISSCLTAIVLFFHGPLLAFDLPEKAHALVEEAEKIRSQSPQIAQIWPGFWSESEPFIVFNNEGETLIFTTGEPLPGYSAEQDNYYYYTERLPNTSDFAFFINYPLPNNQRATAVRMGDNRSDTLDTLVHEAFHGYQDTHFKNLHQLSFIEPSYFSSPMIRGLIRFQFSLAQKAHAVQSETLVRDWLTFRVAFQHAVAPEVGELLAGFEHLEGTAHWVGIQAAYAEHSRNQLGDFLRHFQARFENSNDVRTSSYATGAFLTDILNEYAPASYYWRTKLEEGSTPLNVAAALFEIDGETAMQEMNALLERHNANDYIQAAESMAPNETLRFSTVEETYPYNLTIILSLDINEDEFRLPLHFSPGADGFENLSSSVMFTPNPSTFQVNYKGTRIDIRGVPALYNLETVANGKLRIQVWSKTPIVNPSELALDQPLVLEFGDSIIRSSSKWRLLSQEPNTQTIEID